MSPAPNVSTKICLTAFILLARHRNGVSSSAIDFANLGGIPDDDSEAAQWANAELLNETLQGLQQGQTFTVGGKFYMMGGIYAEGLTDVTIRLDGEIVFSADTANWPRDDCGRVMECIELWDPCNLKLTSSTIGGGVLDGRGWAWWHIPAIGYLVHAEDRPRLLHVYYGTNVLLENWLLINPPYWATYFVGMDGLEIRYSAVMARRTGKEGHDLEDMTAFNTDGFDVSGRNVWIHDCNLWCQDDAIAVKDGSENMLFERINASGVGLTIGSIGKSEVRNITFRDCYMYKTYKGIYMKFRNAENESSYRDDGIIEDVLFENVVMDEPQHWPIWIGPAQQSDARNPCYPNPCSICFPLFPGMQCEGQSLGGYRNITLRNITINRPRTSAGVLLAHEGNPMTDVIFDNVRVNLCGESSYGGTVGLNVDLGPPASFPLLPADRYAHPAASDRYVTSWRLFLGALALVSAGALWQWGGHLMTLWNSAGDLAKLTVIAMGITVPMAAWLTRGNHPVSRRDSYFICNGVQGVAVGDTWPVPSCFDDQTTSDGQSGRCPQDWVAPVIFVSFAFLATYLYFVLAKPGSASYDMAGLQEGQDQQADSFVRMEDVQSFELGPIPRTGEFT